MKIHKTAEVSEDATIGEGTSVWNNAQVREGAVIGEGCVISKDVYIDTDVKIGSKTKIQNGVNVYKGVTIGNGVFCGPRMTFTNDLFPRAHTWSEDLIGETIVKDGASIGAGAIIVCGNEEPRVIGEHALVAAGSVVTKDIPDNGFVMGTPARLKGFVCECANKLDKVSEEEDDVKMSCSKCDNSYKIEKKDYVMIQ